MYCDETILGVYFKQYKMLFDIYVLFENNARTLIYYMFINSLLHNIIMFSINN